MCVYGGGNRREQINTVKKGVEIIVATPGRLNDLINSEVIDVKSVTYLVSSWWSERPLLSLHPVWAGGHFSLTIQT